MFQFYLDTVPLMVTLPLCTSRNSAKVYKFFNIHLSGRRKMAFRQRFQTDSYFSSTDNYLIFALLISLKSAVQARPGIGVDSLFGVLMT